MNQETVDLARQKLGTKADVSVRDFADRAILLLFLLWRIKNYRSDYLWIDQFLISNCYPVNIF